MVLLVLLGESPLEAMLLGESPLEAKASRATMALDLK